MDDEPTGRDIRTIWKTIAVVGSVIAVVIGVAAVLIPWGNSLSNNDVAILLRVTTVEKRLDKLERWRERQQDNMPRLPHERQ